MPNRAAILLRQSSRKPGSESLDMQEQVCRAKAAALKAEVVTVARDEAISAFKIHPMKRPKLGPVFEANDDLDLLIYYKQSRCFRRVVPDFSDVVMWATTHDVLLVSATENLGDPRQHKELLVPLITAWADQGSSEATSGFLTDLFAMNRAAGRWSGGKPPYGYKSIPIGLKQHKLAIDDEAAAIVREAVARVQRGESLNSICADFNRRDIPSPDNRMRQLTGGKLIFRDDGTLRRWTLGRWQRGSLSIILRSPAIVGHLMHGKQEVRGEDGAPVIGAPPIITEKEWEQVKLILGDHRVPKRSQRSSLLLRVAFCICGCPLYRWSTTSRGKRYTHYKCLKLCRPDKYPESCQSRPIPSGWLDDYATQIFLARVGHAEITRKVVIGDDSHARKLAAVGKKIASLTEQRYVQEIITPDFDATMARLQEEHAHLSAIDTPEPRIEEEGTGRTFAQEWADRDEAGRRQLMIGAGFRLIYARLPDEAYVQVVEVDERIAERARLAVGGELVQVPESKLADAFGPAREVLNRPRPVR
jgi:DNA invertase Pin-like site-specific DNA recombinase